MAGKTDKSRSIADVLGKIQKDYDLRIGSLSAMAADVRALTTGNIAIDDVIGVNGFPVGRSIELFGPPSSGKTTTGLQCAAAEQQRIIAEGTDEAILFMDYEHALDPTYCRQLGLDLDHPSFLFSQPDNFEQGANASIALIETGLVPVMLVDSVAAMTPSDKLDAEVGKSLPAIQARLMSDYMQKLNSLLNEHKTTAIFLNHLKEVFEMGGSRPGMPPRTSTPGGKALKFYASVRVEYQQIKNVKGKVRDHLTGEYVDQVEATNVRVRVVKNKVAPPFRQCTVRVRYGRGFDSFWSAIQILIGHKRVPNSAGFYYFDKVPAALVHPDMAVGTTKNARPYIRGEEVLLQFADAHPEWRDGVIAYASEVVKEARAAGPTALDTDPEPDEDDGSDAVPSLVGDSGLFAS